MNQHTPLIQMLIEAEGNIDHMYLDTKGFVTVGVGHLLATPEDASLLPFVFYADDTDAGQGAVTADWRVVKAQTPGKLAAYYKQFCRSHLHPADVMTLLNVDIAEIERGVAGHFIGFSEFPFSPQDALLDMAFNLGPGGLAKYTKLRDAAERRDWRTCADECYRHGISEFRNKATRQLFLDAAQASPAQAQESA